MTVPTMIHKSLTPKAHLLNTNGKGRQTTSLQLLHKTEMFIKWMAHEDRPYGLHDDFLSTLTRDNYLKFRHMDSQSFKCLSASSSSHHEPSKPKTSSSGESNHQVPSESETALNNYKKGYQRSAFLSQQEEISDDDEYANAEKQFLH